MRGVLARRLGRGVEVERSFAQLWTVRDGAVVRFRAYPDRHSALRAALTAQLLQVGRQDVMPFSSPLGLSRPAIDGIVSPSGMARV